jgi:hypothetical protein
VRGAHNGSSPYPGAMAAAIVLRNNSGDNSEFTIGNAVSDTIVEGNALIDSDEGLQMINTSTNPTRVYQSHNRGL